MSSAFDPRKHHRRSIRLPGYDYSQSGAYFITLVAWHRRCLFGEVVGGELLLNEFGRLVRDEWERTPIIRPEVELGEYVVMPNHFHAVVVFNVSHEGAHSSTPVHAPVRGVAHRPPRSLGSLIAGFKSSVTKRINILRRSPSVPVWQRNYYEHVIRDESDLQNISNYIAGNPMLWDQDEENTAASA